jgi:hypothetical protein
MGAKMKYIGRNLSESSNQEMFAISLSSCSRYNASTQHSNIVGDPRKR